MFDGDEMEKSHMSRQLLKAGEMISIRSQLRIPNAKSIKELGRLFGFHLNSVTVSETLDDEEEEDRGCFSKITPLG
jgi:hypothetical protein